MPLFQAMFWSFVKKCKQLPMSFAVFIWPLGIGCAALLTVALVWSFYWWSVAGQSLAAFDAWVERQARDQRQYECSERTVGGFPFRLRVTCSLLTAKISDRQGGLLQFELANPQFRMNIVDPALVSLEAKGPLLRVGDRENPQWEVRWEKFKAVFQWRQEHNGFFLEKTPVMASLHMRDVIVHRLEKAVPDLVAGQINLEWRFDPATPDTANVGLMLKEAFWGASKLPTHVTLGTQLNQIPVLYPQTLVSFIKEFSFSKTEILFTQVRFKAPQVDIFIRGDAGLDNQNRIKGTFTLHGKGIEQLPALLPLSFLPDTKGLAVIGARLAIDPGRLSFAAADGRLFVSGVPVMPLNPLY